MYLTAQASTVLTLEHFGWLDECLLWKHFSNNNHSFFLDKTVFFVGISDLALLLIVDSMPTKFNKISTLATIMPRTHIVNFLGASISNELTTAKPREQCGMRLQKHSSSDYSWVKYADNWGFLHIPIFLPRSILADTAPMMTSKVRFLRKSVIFNASSENGSFQTSWVTFSVSVNTWYWEPSSTILMRKVDIWWSWSSPSLKKKNSILPTNLQWLDWKTYCICVWVYSEISGHCPLRYQQSFWFWSARNLWGKD